MAIYASSSFQGFYDDAIHQSLPPDALRITAELHQQLLQAQQDGKTIDWSASPPEARERPSPSPEQQQAALDRAVQRRLDTQARAWGFDSMDRAATYAASTVAKWRTEAQALIAWRDATWQAAYAAQQAVLAGTRPIPTEAQLMAELPAAPVRPT